MSSVGLAQAAASPPAPRSAGVRIDADVRAKLAELQKRLLAQSSRGPDIEVRRAGIPFGAVVEKALRALERELNASTTQENDGPEATEGPIARNESAG